MSFVVREKEVVYVETYDETHFAVERGFSGNDPRIRSATYLQRVIWAKR